jgi:hypothetical protein
VWQVAAPCVVDDPLFADEARIGAVPKRRK